MSNSHYRPQSSSAIVEDSQKDLNFNLNETKVEMIMSQSPNILSKSTTANTVSPTIGTSSKLMLNSAINTSLGNSYSNKSPIHRQIQFIQNPISNAATVSSSSSSSTLTSTISSVNMSSNIFSSSNSNHKLISAELVLPNQRQISSSNTNNIISTKDNLSNTISISCTSSANTLISNDNTLTSISGNTPLHVPISITNDDVNSSSKTGAKDSLYGKGKQYFSPGCVRGQQEQDEISDVKNKNSFVKLLRYSEPMYTLVTNSPSNSSISFVSAPQQQSDGTSQYNVSEQTEKKVCSSYRIALHNKIPTNQKLVNSKQFAQLTSHQQTPGAIEHSSVSAQLQSSQSPLSSSRRRNYPLTFGNFSQSPALISQQQIGQQPQNQILPQRFQLTNNRNMVLNVNNQTNCVLPNQQQTIATIVPPKRTKKNNQQHQNGQNLITTGTNTVKRVRSKSNSSLSSPLMADVNFESMSSQYLKSTPSTCTSTSSNSILVNQLKKPPVMGVVHTTNSISPETATLTSNQSISTNSSLLLHLTTANSSTGQTITQLSRPITSANQLQLFPQKNFLTTPVTTTTTTTNANNSISNNNNTNNNNSSSNSNSNNNNFLHFHQQAKQINQNEFVQGQVEQLIKSNNTNTNVGIKSIQLQNDYSKGGPIIEGQEESFVEDNMPSSSSSPPSISIIEKIKALDSYFDGTSTADVSDNSECNIPARAHYNNGSFSKYYPPVWRLIFEKFSHNYCAPVWAFPNAPLNQQWQTLFPNLDINNSRQQQQTNVYVEIRLTAQDLQQTNGTLMSSNTPTTNNLLTSNKIKLKKNSFDLIANSSEEMDKFWFVKIIGHSGYYLQVRYVGLENSKYDFWINIRLRNLYPVGYAINNYYQYKAPLEVSLNNPNYMDTVRSILNNGQSIDFSLYEKFFEEIETQLKPGIKVETVDKNCYGRFRVATILKIVGKRCLVRYDGEPPDDKSELWIHAYSENLRPIGWSSLVGQKLFASNEYVKKSLQHSVQNIRHHIKCNNNRLDFNKIGVLKKFEYIDRNLLFREGMKVEVVNPWQLSSICVATVKKVLRFNYLILSIDDMLMDTKLANYNLYTSIPQSSSTSEELLSSQENRMFCIHSSSPYLLPAGFCRTYDITLTPPKDYTQEFNWVDYCSQTNSIIAPVDFFSYKHFITDIEHNYCMFKEGMLLEAVDMMEPSLICVAIIKRRAGRLLLLHFIGWNDSYDQWLDFCSPNIFPVGYSDLIDYPLEGPPNKQTQSYCAGYNRKRNKKMSSSKCKSYRSQLSFDDNIKKNDCKEANVENNKEIDDGEDNYMSGSEDNSLDNNENKAPQITNIWLQTKERESSEMYNFLSWNKTIVNNKPFVDHNKFLMPLDSVINIEDNKQILFNELFNDRLFNDKHENIILEGPYSNQHQLTSIKENECKIYDSFQYFNPENTEPDGTTDIRMLPFWSSKQVSNFLYRKGFSNLCDSILVFDIDGKRLLTMKHSEAMHLALIPSTTNRLLSFIDCIKKFLNVNISDFSTNKNIRREMNHL